MMISMVKSKSWWLGAAIIIAIIATGLSIRIPIALERKIMPAGDVFNLQHIADFIARFDYPIRENRLPGFPALILLTRPLPIDPVVAAVGLSLAASTLTVICLYFTGRALSLHRVALFTFLSLSLFDPILIVSSVRPLSDATFIFWFALFVLLLTRQLTKKSPPTRRNLFLIGVIITAMILTRYEGYLVAAFAFPTLWIVLPWRKVLTAAAIPFVAALLWIPAYIHIHGSLTGGYIAELSKPGNNFGGAADVPTKFIAMLEGAGWGTTWTLPADEIKNDPKDEAVQRILSLPAWWISLLGVIGALWLAVKQRTKALPLFLALFGYINVIVWWLVYSRFVAPIIPFFYLSVAAGASLILYIIPRRFWLGTLAISAGFTWLLWTEAPRLYHLGLGRAWEGNQRGYSLFDAVRKTAKLPGKTAYWTEGHAFATLYLKDKGFYFSRYEDKSPQEIYDAMREQKIAYFVDNGDDERVIPVANLLKQHNNIQNITTYRSVYWADNSVEEVPVYQLKW